MSYRLSGKGPVFEGSITSVKVPRRGYKWYGVVKVRAEHLGEVSLLMTGVIAQWLLPGEKVKITLLEEPKVVDSSKILGFNDYLLHRLWGLDWVPVWPPFQEEFTLPRKDPLTGRTLYQYHVVAREALTEHDYEEIVGLEQYHYASKEELVAIWRCLLCGEYAEANAQPECPRCKTPMRIQEIRGSLPSSRFLVLELKSRQPYEPKVIAYVRVDTPIPLMSRRLTPQGDRIEHMIREKVFPKEWFHPTYWPQVYQEWQKVVSRYRDLAKLYGRSLAMAMVGEEIAEEALKRANTAAARIARVVVHPDYRGDGFGVLAVTAALKWIKERRIPEMRKPKHVVETIAQMARYNPFFEKAGFKYMWETRSGRPVLMYPLTLEAEEKIGSFLSKDPYASKHGGKLYRSRFGEVEPLSAPIRLKGLTKMYSSTLDVQRLPEDLQEVLKAFGVERRVVERYVVRDADLEIAPREIAVVVGASGAGKTTLLRMMVGGALKLEDPGYVPSSGKVEVPKNARLAYLFPGEHEPSFGDEPLLEHVKRKCGDIALAVEILNTVGLSDAVFYRARFQELSTGQKERAKLASLLAEKPNLLVIDEFTAHLDALTGRRVARKLGEVAKRAGITLIVATNRPEIIDALSPTKMIYVGYGALHAAAPQLPSR